MSLIKKSFIKRNRSPKAAGYPTILRNLGFWVRKLTFLGFLADFTKGK